MEGPRFPSMASGQPCIPPAEYKTTDTVEFVVGATTELGNSSRFWLNESKVHLHHSSAKFQDHCAGKAVLAEGGDCKMTASADNELVFA